MREELDDKLCRDFPNLYRDRNADPRHTCMCWGFPGDGWFNLIWDLSWKLERELRKMPLAVREHFAASQVKEKYGTLRFYMTASTQPMDKLIRQAEQASARICEECGKPGKLRNRGGWWYISCRKHIQKMK